MELNGTTQHATPQLFWERAFLTSLEETGVILRACKAAEVGRTTVWRHRQSDPDFLERFETALKCGALALEEEAVRRAKDGLIKKKFTAKGEPIIDPETGKQYVEHEYSDMLLLALLRRHFPDKYRENRTQVEVNATAIAGNVVVSQEEQKAFQERVKRALEDSATPETPGT